MNCPLCGTDGAYAGLRQLECRNYRCNGFRKDYYFDHITTVVNDYLVTLKDLPYTSDILDVASNTIKRCVREELYGYAVHLKIKKKIDFTINFQIVMGEGTRIAGATVCEFVIDNQKVK